MPPTSKPISAFANGNPPQVGDELVFERANVTLKITWAQMLAAMPGGGGAPTDAEYIVGALHGGLTAERVVTDTSEITFDLATAGQLKANVGAIAQAKVTGLVADLAGKESTGVAAALVTAHEAAPDPHPQYLTSAEADVLFLTPAEGNAAYDALGAAVAVVVAHEAAGDPHPQYLTPAEGNAAYDVLGAAAARQQNIQFKDEGVNQGVAGGVGIVNFVGAGVAAVEAGGTLTVTIAGGGGGGSADIIAATVNVATPTIEAEIVVVDAVVAATDRILVSWGNCAQEDANHPSMGNVAFNAIAGVGQFILEIFSLDNTMLFGDFKINYMKAA